MSTPTQGASDAADNSAHRDLLTLLNSYRRTHNKADFEEAFPQMERLIRSIAKGTPPDLLGDIINEACFALSQALLARGDEIRAPVSFLVGIANNIIASRRRRRTARELLVGDFDEKVGHAREPLVGDFDEEVGHSAAVAAAAAASKPLGFDDEFGPLGFRRLSNTKAFRDLARARWLKPEERAPNLGSLGPKALLIGQNYSIDRELGEHLRCLIEEFRARYPNVETRERYLRKVRLSLEGEYCPASQDPS